MTQHRATQLERIQELARAREQELALEVSELSRRRDGEEATLARLGGYLEEYTSAAATGSRRLYEMDNERRFVERLGKAVRQQHVQVERLTERMRVATERWHVARAELEALARVIEGREQTRQLAERRRDQREADAVTTQRRNHAPEVFQ